MENKAQASLEYLVIASVVLILALVVTAAALITNSTAAGLKDTTTIYARKAIEMFK